MKLVPCKECEFKEMCEETNGAEREDGDDYRACRGTHFCLQSWKAFYEHVGH